MHQVTPDKCINKVVLWAHSHSSTTDRDTNLLELKIDALVDSNTQPSEKNGQHISLWSQREHLLLQ